MDLQGIVSTLLPLLPKVLVIALVFLGVISLLYMVYRKRGGKRKFSVLHQPRLTVFYR